MAVFVVAFLMMMVLQHLVVRMVPPPSTEPVALATNEV
jgi:hypothetical protein